MIRHATLDDIPQMAALHARFWGTEGQPHETGVASLERHIERVYFENPWHSDEIPSLVFEESTGQISGMMCVIARPMEFHGETVQMAVSSELTVDPESRSRMAAVQILKAYMNGKQDLAIADGAYENSRKVWNAMGGADVALYGYHWMRLLRPCAAGLAKVRQRRALKPLAAICRPIVGALDAVAGSVKKSPFHFGMGSLTTQPLTPRLFAHRLAHFAKADDLHPIYDDESSDWIWGRLDRMWESGEVHRVAVGNEHGDIIGWYIYHLAEEGTANVAHLAATERTVDDVLAHLFHHAWQHGAHTIGGRVHPRFAQPLAARQCLFHRKGRPMLVHARNEELLRAFERGSVFISALEGELSLSHHVRDEQANLPRRAVTTTTVGAAAVTK